jgi:hypothetical protein
VVNPASGSGPQQGQPDTSGDSGNEDKKRDRRTQITVALIGAVAVIAAAIIGIIHPWSSGGLQLGIISVSHPVVNGKRVIEVTGTVANLGADEFVYAFAGAQAGIPPWYPGGPAAISGSGMWTAEVTSLPAAAANFSVWAGVASSLPLPSQECQPPPQPCTPPPSQRQLQLSKIAATGPHAPQLKLVTPAYHVALPGS